MQWWFQGHKPRHNYQPLNYDGPIDNNRTSRLESCLHFIKTYLLPAAVVLVLGSLGTVTCLLIRWLSSNDRQIRILARELSCADSDIPWWFFTPSKEIYPPKVFSEMFSIPPRSRELSNSSLSSSSTSTPPPCIAHVQLCSRAYKDAWGIEFLLGNHRAYAQQHGYEYTLYTEGGKERGVWRKIEVLLEKVDIELAKQRQADPSAISWLLYVTLSLDVISKANMSGLC